MALDFPASPTNGQTYTAAGLTWVYNSTYGTWDISSPGPIGYTGSQGPIGYTGSAGASSGGYYIDATAAGINLYQTFYVDIVNGSDTNNGLTNTTAWKNFDYAINYISKLVWPYTNGAVSLQVNDGTYTLGNISSNNGFPALQGIDNLYIYSQNTPALSILDFQNNTMLFKNAGYYNFSGLTFSNVAGVQAYGGYTAIDYSVFNFTASPYASLFDVNHYSSYEPDLELNDPTINAATASVTNIFSVSNSKLKITTGATLNVQSCTNFLNVTSMGSVEAAGCTFTQTQTVNGKKFNIDKLSRVYTGTSGNTSYFPGAVAGTVETNSIYY